MYHQLYSEIAGDSAVSARARERDAIQVAINKLSRAKGHGARTPQSFEATNYLRRLWTIFMLDLNTEENGLPAALRASLISIGLWVLREADLIDEGAS
ncbi:MAG: flagellar biosynthesis regulator FlaF, partial [Methylocystis sp.]|nr:flagellar biosynthesis regulator FlaF [Methylocystis sp.]